MNPIDAIAGLFNLLMFNEFDTYHQETINLIDIYRINIGTQLNFADVNFGYFASLLVGSIAIIIAIYYLFDICILIYKRCTK